MTRMKLVRLGILVCVALGAGSCVQMDGPFSSGGVNLLETGLFGWQQMGGPIDAWRFEGGVLYCGGKGGGWLSTIDRYDDFELSLEFRVPAGGNGGVFLRAPHDGDPAYTGMEIQLLDDNAPQYAVLRATQYTGSIYDVQAPSQRVGKPAGEWQSMFIRCKGRRVKIWLNDKTIVDANLDSFDRKYQTHPGLTREGGYIGLQDHGSRLAFRNIWIKTLK
jgi:hypothetical protein